jgi:hypothetical protein
MVICHVCNRVLADSCCCYEVQDAQTRCAYNRGTKSHMGLWLWLGKPIATKLPVYASLHLVVRNNETLNYASGVNSGSLQLVVKIMKL